MSEISEPENYNRLHLRLLEMIAHDVKTPMDSLAMLLSVLKGKRLDDEEYTVFFDSVQTHIQSSRNLMQDLLSWAKIRLNGLDDQYDFVLMKRINSDIIQSVEYFTSEKDISILDQTEEDLKSLIHVNLYRFIVRNLLINGIKYSHKRQNIHIKAYHNNGNLEVAVTDKGIGVSSDKLEEIFRFTGKTDPGTMNEKGTGIGLMLCYEILKQYGGKLWARSALGAGTTFYFSVPDSNGNSF
ncbi:sensor histidine kinase KdpD [Daejeonella sp.]|uniref:sensor histidine kinase n=1 Tax=Daejeonella sp. TaxID=2805397 RepID=UPI0027249C56|nr:HAMP domain-containing sensor histidine kinase [Daejeonella sp.]MDO8994300.1 HAMP domain-containing sensor histidine kinase [Daejeonella sp.]MDP2414033.1 HAMP domain-containing sensor histidine kinase [Daejeonella sp.]